MRGSFWLHRLANGAAELPYRLSAPCTALLPLWRFCRKGFCRRHKQCSGEIRPCLKRGWQLMPAELQKKAYAQVAVGGPRRLPPSTHTEWVLRRYAPSNFVH